MNFVTEALNKISLSLPNAFKFVCENYKELSEERLENIIFTGVTSELLYVVPELDLYKFSSDYSFDFLLGKLEASFTDLDEFLSLSIVSRIHTNKPVKSQVSRLWKVFKNVEFTEELYTKTRNVNFLYHAVFATTQHDCYQYTIPKKSSMVDTFEFTHTSRVYTVSTKPARKYFDNVVDVRTGSEFELEEMLNKKRDTIEFPFVRVPTFKTVYGKVVNRCKKSDSTFIRCRTLKDNKAMLVLAGVIGKEEVNYMLESKDMKRLNRQQTTFLEEWKVWEKIEDYSKVLKTKTPITDKFTVERILNRYTRQLNRFIYMTYQRKKSKSRRERERIGVPVYPDVNELAKRYTEEKEETPVTPSNPPATLPLEPLENGYMCKVHITSSGYTYASVDHYLVSQKYIGMFANEANEEFCRKIKTSTEPLPNPLPSFLIERPDWDEMKNKLLEKALHAKFFNNEYLEAVLLSTGDKPLTLRSDDKSWDYRGENVLNIFLQNIRQKIRIKKGACVDPPVYSVWYHTFDNKDTRFKKKVGVKIPKWRDCPEEQYYYYRNATTSELKEMTGTDGEYYYARQRSKYPTLVTKNWVYKGPYRDDEEDLALVYHRCLKLKFHGAKFIPKIIIKGGGGMYFKSPNILSEFPKTVMKPLNGKDDEPLVPILKNPNHARVKYKEGCRVAFSEISAWTTDEAEKARQSMKNNPQKINGLMDCEWENILYYMACCHFLSVQDCCFENIMGCYGITYTGCNTDPGGDIEHMLIPGKKLYQAEMYTFYKALRMFKGKVLQKFVDRQTREHLNSTEKFKFDTLMSSWLLTGENLPWYL